MTDTVTRRQMLLFSEKANNIKILRKPLPVSQLLSEYADPELHEKISVNIEVNLGDLVGIDRDVVLDFLESKVCSDGCCMFDIRYRPIAVTKDGNIILNINGWYDEEIIQEALGENIE